MSLPELYRRAAWAELRLYRHSQDPDHARRAAEYFLASDDISHAKRAAFVAGVRLLFIAEPDEAYDVLRFATRGTSPSTRAARMFFRIAFEPEDLPKAVCLMCHDDVERRAGRNISVCPSCASNAVDMIPKGPGRRPRPHDNGFTLTCLECSRPVGNAKVCGTRHGFVCLECLKGFADDDGDNPRR